MHHKIADIYDAAQEIALLFGSREINGACCDDLSFVEFMALKKIHEHRTFTIQEIGRALKFTKSGATRIIDRLEDRGYVTRQTSPRDGRVCCVTCSARGTKAISKAAAKYTRFFKAILQEMESEQVEQIRRALKTLALAVRKR
ncbi:MAG: MarR family transcriptional regulator [Candidatus Aminicenantes bacterium]|nr:MarR family transcriptional regulator [Candidatus Aminicenantes bacterium]